MVVEELQILVGCDASTAEKTLKDLEERLTRFMKQSSSGYSNSKSVKEQVQLEKESVTTNNLRTKAAESMRRISKAITNTQQQQIQAEKRLRQEIADTTSEYQRQTSSASSAQGTIGNRIDEEIARLQKEKDKLLDAINGTDKTTEKSNISNEDLGKWLDRAAEVGTYERKVSALEAKLQHLLEIEQRMEQTDEFGSDKWARVQNQIVSVTDQLLKLNNAAKEADQEVGKGNGFKKLVEVAKAAGAKIARAFSSVGGTVKNVLSKAVDIAKGRVIKLTSSFSKFGQAVTKILSRMIIWRSINAIIMGAQEGFQNIALASSKANAALSDLQSGMTYIKNSIAAMLLPALQSILPVINRVIQAIASLFNMIGALFAKLRGESTFTKAVYVQQDYAASLNKSNKAAKELQGTLAGFDQINLIQQQSGGSGSGGTDVSGMVEETEVESVLPSDISKWVAKLKEAIAAADWQGVGKLIADGMNSGLSALDNWINTTMRPKGVSMMQAFTSGLNGFISGFDWSSLGQTVANGMNTVAEILYTFWNNTDWAGMGNGIGTALTGWIESLDVEKIASSFSAKIKGLLDLAVNLIEATDWQELGTKLTELIQAVKWSDIASTLMELLGAALGGLSGFIVGLISPVWQDVKEWWTGIMEQTGGDIIAGLFLGIVDAVKNIAAWIKEHIFQPFIDGFKKAFGIASPSKEMAEQGNFIIQGMLEGIKAALSSIASWVQTNVFDPVMNAVRNAFGIVGDTANKLKEIGSALIEGIKSGITKAWTSFTSWIGEKFSSVISTAKDVFGIHSPSKVFAGIGGNIMAGMVQGIQRGKAAAVQSMQDVSRSLQGAFSVNTNIPALAKGGIAYGDTLAQVGEYANARSNPEVIAPLDKLQSLISGISKEDTQTIIKLLKRIAEQDNELALYPSAKLGRIASLSIKMYNSTVGAV